MEKLLKIKREKYTSKENVERYSYYVDGVIRGKEVKATLIPTDIGGYDVLDIVFVGVDTADLVLVPYSIEDKETKQVIKGVNFEARTIDENGEAYTCKVKPRQASDKAIIEMLLARL